MTESKTKGVKYCNNCGTYVKTEKQERQSIGNFDFGAVYSIETCVYCNNRLSKIEIQPGKCCLPAYN